MSTHLQRCSMDPRPHAFAALISCLIWERKNEFSSSLMVLTPFSSVDSLPWKNLPAASNYSRCEVGKSRSL